MDIQPGINLSKQPHAAASGQLYHRTSVFIATLIGSVLAGGILMAWNYQRSGQIALAKKTYLYSFLGLLGTLALSLVIPASVPGAAIIVPLSFVMSHLQNHYQGAMIATHLKNGGALASKWKAAGVGLLVMVAIILLLIAVLGFYA